MPTNAMAANAAYRPIDQRNSGGWLRPNSISRSSSQIATSTTGTRKR
jgi:hypothetical protein